MTVTSWQTGAGLEQESHGLNQEGILEDVHLERSLDQHLVKHQEQPQQGPQHQDQLLPPFYHDDDEVHRLLHDDEQGYQLLLLEVQQHLAEKAPVLQ